MIQQERPKWFTNSISTLDLGILAKTQIREAQTPPTFLLTRTALVEEYPDEKYVYGRWDTIFGAWECASHSPVAEFVPAFSFKKMAPFGEYIDAADLYDCPARRAKLNDVLEHYQDLISLDLFDVPDSEESPQEVNAYLALIPERFQDATAVLGGYSWLGLEACWYFEEFSDWLLRSRWHGRLAASIWYLANAQCMPRHQRRALNQRIYNEHPLTLISTYMPRPEARYFVNLLKRLRGVLRGCDLQALKHLVRAPRRVQALSYIRELRVETLPALAIMPVWLERPAAVDGAIRGGEASLEFLGLVQRHPTLLDCTIKTWIAKRMEAVRGASDVRDLMERWERRIAAVTPFPGPPLVLPQPFEPIDASRKLKHEGRQMANCSADYLADVLSGNAYFYHWSGAEPATVRLECVPPGGWRLAEMKGPRNADLPPAILLAINGIIAQAQGAQGRLKR